jgi:hypothetical protein
MSVKGIMKNLTISYFLELAGKWPTSIHVFDNFTWQQELLKLVLCHRVTSGSHPKKLHT